MKKIASMNKREVLMNLSKLAKLQNKLLQKISARGQYDPKRPSFDLLSKDSPELASMFNEAMDHLEQAADKVDEFHSKLDEIEKYAKAHKEELHLKSIDVDGFTHDMQQFETGFTKIKSHIYRTIGHFVESLSDISYHDRGQYDPSQDHWVRYDEVYQVGPKNKNWLKPHDEWEK